MNLREKHGYSYGVQLVVSLLRDNGTFAAPGGIVAKNTVDAVKEYENELKKFSDGEVSDAELARGQGGARAQPAGCARDQRRRLRRDGQPGLAAACRWTTTARFPAKVGKVTQEDVQRVVTQLVKPDRWPVVIVGPVAQSKDALEKLNLGPVSIAPAVPAAKPSASSP